MIKADFGDSLRRRRLRKKMTLEDLAAESGLSLRFVQSLEAGTKGPSLKTLFRLSEALEVTPNTLIDTAFKKWRSARK